MVFAFRFFFVIGPALAVWAVILAAIGLTRPEFPRGLGAQRTARFYGAVEAQTAQTNLQSAADQLGIQVSDEEVDQAFRDRFDEPDKIIEQAREAGAYDTERESMRLARALDRIAVTVSASD